ncbi:MAG: glycerol-3-phosphate 1-O-acyltransferase PlsY [Negativicutes bacterium]
MPLFLACVASYLIGSIPNGLIFGKLFWGVDLRERGSHNIGATNAWRTLGKGPGFLIFFLDFLKGVCGVYLGSLTDSSPTSLVLGGLMAIVGHSCSLFLRFKGGKGVATGLGVIAMLMPKTTILIFLLWFLLVYFTGYVSLGSVVAASFVPFLAWWGHEPEAYIVFGITAAIFVIYRHKTNIQRLLAGTESKIKAGKRS